MLTRAQKEQKIAGLKSDIENANALFLTNLIGITSNDAVGIRKGVRENEGKIVITRNTLFAKAAEGTYAAELLTGLKGPHAVAIALGDAPGVAKCLKEAGEDHEVVEFKGGYLKGEALSIDQIKMLAALPSRDEMLGTLLATFMAPIAAFARVMHAIGEQKAEGSPAVEAAPAAEADAAAEAATEEPKGEE
jgi:large subunit ribosomal protein L10